MNKNKYIIYGTLVLYDWYDNWKKNNKNFVVSEKEVGYITHIFNGRDGKFVIIGEILIKTSEDFISIPEINEERQKYIMNRVNVLYGLKGVFHYFYVKDYSND